MRNRELIRQIQIIESLFNKTSTFVSELELQSHWAKYICILCSGLLENAIELIYLDYIEQSSSNKRIKRFASNYVSRVQNVNATKMIEIAGYFDRTWAEKLKDYLAKEGRKEAIDTIIKNRHDIAHGRTSTITVSRLKDYFDKSIRVLEFIEKQCAQ